MEPKNKLTRVVLPPDWIDLGYGDTAVVGQALRNQLNHPRSRYKAPQSQDWSYLPPNGLPDLVSFLESKYGRRVIVTNGGKQGVAAAMYAAKAFGHKSIAAHKPYWPSITAIYEDLGIKPYFCDIIDTEKPDSCNAAIIASPANPDGREMLNYLDATSIDEKGCIIHDAAYHNEVYMDEKMMGVYGDMQVFSYSKMLGMGGVRLGYVVCHDDKYADKVTEFVERTSSSVSVESQRLVLGIEQHFKQYPSEKWFFVYEARRAIQDARIEFCKIDPDVILIDDCDEFAMEMGMFAWFKAGPKLDLKAAKVHALEGTIFGKPGYIRFNLAVGPDVIREAVQRLNRKKKK